MATARKPPPPLTSRMQRVLALDGPFYGRPRPTPEEMEGVLGVLAEGARAAGRLHVGRAIQIAADNAPDSRTARLIARVLKDGKAQLGLRLQAAASLGDIPVRTAAKALAEMLTQSDAALEPALLQSLAKVGDVDAAAIIVARPAPRSRRLAQLRAYARAAILVRAGKTLDSAAAEAVLPTGVAIDVHPESRTAVEAALARFRGSRYDVQLTSELGWRLRCGGDDHLLLLAAQMARGRRMAWLAGGARIAGLLAMRDDQHGDVWSVRRLVMTRPVDGGFQVSVLRPDGEVELLGSLTPSGEGNHRLALRSTGRAPVPLAIDGTVSEETIRFQLRQFATQRAAKLVGEVDPATL